MGKGSKQRPAVVDQRVLAANWHLAFPPKPAPVLVCVKCDQPARWCSCQGLITLVEASD